MSNAADAVVERPTVASTAGRARRCPVCDDGRAERLFHNRMAPIADIDFGYAVVACDRCGMVYAAEAPDAATLDRYYRELSKYDHPARVDDVNPVDRDRAEVAAAFTRRHVPMGGRVLDVGCSIGVYLATLARTGFAVRGLDPSPSAAAAAAALFGVQVDVGAACDHDGYGDFDAIALLAVLEHLREPRALLATIAARMKPGATLIVEVPDAGAFGDYPAIGRVSEPFGEFSNEHINYFGDASLRRLAADVGLAHVTSEPFPYLLGIRGLLAAFLKMPVDPSDRGRRAGDDGASVRRYVTRSARALACVEARLVAVGVDRRPIVLYGAGSHSARLLAQGVLRDASIDVVLDRNAHLAGRRIRGVPIASPAALADHPDRPVVVSSFHAMRPIATALAKQGGREIVTLYDRP